MRQFSDRAIRLLLADMKVTGALTDKRDDEIAALLIEHVSGDSGSPGEVNPVHALVMEAAERLGAREDRLLRAERVLFLFVGDLVRSNWRDFPENIRFVRWAKRTLRQRYRDALVRAIRRSER